MAANLQLANDFVDYGVDAMTARANSGYLRYYDGTQPATANTALSGNTLLAEMRFGATAFAASVNGVAVANAITQDSSANNSGNASFYRVFEADGTTVCWDDNINTASAGITMTPVAITAGQVVTVDSLIFTLPKHV